MMIDVDSLTRHYGPLIAMHYMVATILRQRDFTLKPLAYDANTFFTSTTTKLPFKASSVDATPVLFTGFNIQTCKEYDMVDVIKQPTSTIPIITSSPILYTTNPKIQAVS